jgi:nucleotide-binding universal stress UspA family protein
MKAIFVLFNFHKLSNEAHFEFHDEFRILALTLGIEKLGIAKLFNEIYLPALAVEASVLDFFAWSKFTDKIKRANRHRDSMYRGLASAVKTATYHPDPDKRAAAARLAMILAHYGYMPRRMYEAKIAAIKDLLREFARPENEPLVTAAGVGEWVELLATANEEFVDLLLARDEEIGQRPAVRSREARVAVDEATRALLDRVAALITLNGINSTVDYRPFVADFNAIATRYKHLLAIETGRRAAARKREEVL